MIINFESVSDAVLFRSKFEGKVDEVLRKIHVSSSNMEFLVYKNFVLPKTPQDAIHYIMNRKYSDYGYYNTSSHIIGISVNVLYTCFTHQHLSQNMSGMLYDEKQDLLADVLMDEIAHFITGKDHGDKQYEATLASYRQSFYKGGAMF